MQSEYVTLVFSGVSKMEIISSPPSITGWKLNAVQPTGPIYQQGPGSIFPLSRSVLSIIHEMCLLFFLDPAQHNTSPTAWLPSHAYKFASPVREQVSILQLLSCTSDLTQSVTSTSHLNFTNTTAPGL